MAYAFWVLLGAALAFAARRLQPEPPTPHRHALSLVALIGATAGGFLFEAPADALGWTAGVAGEPAIAHAFGGRTVVGGMLGGWVAVEVAKWALGVVQPTGDGFALPLAIGLACGRMGCFFAGCCAGKPSSGREWWHRLALPGHDGLPRFPAQLTEVAFHAIAAIVLVALARAGKLRYRRLAAYMALYALFRFAIEAVRENPELWLGLTYYQVLAVPLFVLAAGTVLVRSIRAGAPVSPLRPSRPPAAR